MTKDLDKLQNMLLMIEAFLSDIDAMKVEFNAVNLWLKQLEEVAFDAVDVLDETNYALIRQKVANQNGPWGKVTGSFYAVSDNSFFRLKMTRKIKDVNNKLKEITNSASRLGLQNVAIGGASSANATSLTTPIDVQTDSFSVEPNIVGRDDDVSRIVEMITTTPKTKTLSIIPIVGMGGIGKTTLVRKVFHNENIESHFGKKIWVCVSVHFNVENLFKMIIQASSPGENVQALVSREALLLKVGEHFARSRYLLVLDNLWNVESDKWKDFIGCLSGVSHVEGSWIVATTRNSNIAELVGTLPAYQLSLLTRDDCWYVIKSKALPNMEIEDTGKQIAEKCGGLPFAAQIMGGILKGKSAAEWDSILSDELLQDKDIRKMLKLSYDHLLSPTHKKCFAYCSIFPKNSNIKREQLIELWMAEGFLQMDQKIDMEHVGNIIINNLQHSSLFQGEGDFCTMHDLVHDLACEISGSRNAFASRNRLIGTNLVLDFNENNILSISKEQQKQVRTLFLEVEVAFNMISGFKRLHVLKLTGTIVELPTVIGKLIRLRLLDIIDTRIRLLPNSVGKLYNLQTLRADLKRLPNNIVNLINLRHLHFNHTSSVRLPPRIGKLVFLQTLHYYRVGKKKGFRIGELGNLRNLRGKLVISELVNVKDKEEAMHADLFGKTKLLELVFNWYESRRHDNNDEDVLSGLQPHPSLKSLTIRGYQGRYFPEWRSGIQGRQFVGGRIAK